MRLALLAAAIALFAGTTAQAFNPQPDPPGRHATKDRQGRCHDRHNRLITCPRPQPVCREAKSCGPNCVTMVCHR